MCADVWRWFRLEEGRAWPQRRVQQHRLAVEREVQLKTSIKGSEAFDLPRIKEEVVRGALA